MIFEGKDPAAVAWVHGTGIHGKAEFFPRPGGTLVAVRVWGLPRTQTGFFAMHIHEKGDCSGKGFPNTGGHYDPAENPHPMHAGDLPPLLSAEGKAFLAVETGRFRVEDVIGRSLIIHAGPDDFRTQPAGNAGEKIACGVIRKV